MGYCGIMRAFDGLLWDYEGPIMGYCGIMRVP